MQQKEETLDNHTCKQQVVLHVEDQYIFNKIMKCTLEERASYQVVHLTDGSRLLEALEEYQPALLVLDYELPGRNGIELYDLVHAQEQWKDLPSLMLSAALPQEEMAARNLLGLYKPWHSEELLQVVEKVLNQAC